MSKSEIEGKSVKTIILFGETGAGKSSIINMLADSATDPLAHVDDCAQGVTFQTDYYVRQFGDETYGIYDTVGLGEGSRGTLDSGAAIAALYRLMRNTASGVHLLVYVVRGPRITGHHQKTYRMFHDIFCEKQVPIILLLTHMDDVLEQMAGEVWWAQNSWVLREKGMAFSGRACVTGRKNKEGNYHEESQKVVKALIKSTYATDPWLHQGSTAGRFTKVARRLYNQFASALNLGSILVLSETVYRALQLDPLLDEGERRLLANAILEQADAEEKAGKRKRLGRGMINLALQLDSDLDEKRRREVAGHIQEQIEASKRKVASRMWNRYTR
ncbi:hypothetical protein FPV67DRAFT_306782 [Lyophyllum atratum]|nr:hypothetical protein FPV67DRAFT_306782 [Lyophyllum atratum]